jgi:hypothetical protein
MASLVNLSLPSEHLGSLGPEDLEDPFRDPRFLLTTLQVNNNNNSNNLLPTLTSSSNNNNLLQNP